MKRKELMEGTGNCAVDLITCAIEHNKKQNRKIKKILLHFSIYDILLEYLKVDTQVPIGTQLTWEGIPIEERIEDALEPMKIIYEENSAIDGFWRNTGLN